MDPTISCSYFPGGYNVVNAIVRKAKRGWEGERVCVCVCVCVCQLKFRRFLLLLHDIGRTVQSKSI